VSDLLIRGGSIVDGTGAPSRRADIRVRGGRIVEVASDLAAGDEAEIDASGAVVTPGFVDGHTHYDPSLFWDSGCDPLPGHGVTTVVTGNCSLSLAPLRVADRDQLIDMFCFIEDLPVEAFQRGVPWDWETFEEFRGAFDRRGAAVNQASFVGHSAIRLYVMGDASFLRPSDAREREEIVAVFESCLDAGALGLSTSFADVDRRGRPVPSRAADDAEFLALFRKMAERGRGVLEFVPRMQDPQEQMEDIERVHRFGCATGIAATWTQLVVSEQSVSFVDTLLEQAARTQSEGPGVFPQASPRPFDINLSFESTPLFMHQPSWHAFVQATPTQKRAMLVDDRWRARARDDFDAPGPSMFPKDRPEQILLTRVAEAEQEGWLGKSLAAIAEARGVHLSDALADLLVENNLDPGISMVDLSNEDPEQVARLMTSDSTLCAASDAGAHAQMMCGAGDATLLLTKYVRERGDLTLTEAVRRLTSELSDFFGLGDRGRVGVGQFADLAIFDLEEIAYPDPKFVRDLPGGGRRLSRAAGGYRATIVGGALTHVTGRDTLERPGRMIAGERPSGWHREVSGS
jgi:N-acyl-D-aspartate/D-glutamate deacylase